MGFTELARSTSTETNTPAFKKSSLYQFQVCALPIALTKMTHAKNSNAMDIDDKENIDSIKTSLHEIFTDATPPPSITTRRNPTFRRLHISSHSVDESPRSSESETDSPLCGDRFTSRFRPKQKVRRTLSMFQKPGDLLDTEIEEGCNATPPQAPCESMKAEECQILPCFGIKDDMLKRIDNKTVCSF
jgi:hypothetical protein